MHYQSLFLVYEILHRYNPSWQISEFRRMTWRERKYWVDMSEYRIERMSK